MFLATPFATEKAGLTENAMVNGKPYLSRLGNKERVSVLGFLGQSIDGDNRYDSLSDTARALRDLSFQGLDLISSPSRIPFPVVGTEDLFVRQAYKDLYHEITLKFQDSPRNRGVEARCSHWNFRHRKIGLPCILHHQTSCDKP